MSQLKPHEVRDTKKDKVNLHNVILSIAEMVDPRIARWLERHFTVLQYIEFGIVGALGTGINALVFFPLVPVIGYGIAWFLGIIVAFTSNFILDKYLVFTQ